jgi:hypothetical protein
VSEHDALFGYQMRLFALAGEICIRPACRTMGVHHSTYYRWKLRIYRLRVRVPFLRVLTCEGRTSTSSPGASAFKRCERSRFRFRSDS